MSWIRISTTQSQWQAAEENIEQLQEIVLRVSDKVDVKAARRKYAEHISV